MKGQPLSSAKATEWPPKLFSAGGSAGAGQRFTSADRVIVDSDTAVNIADRKHDESSAAKRIGDTSKAWKAGSIIAIVSNSTANDSV
jgi:hypothetical protein